MDAWPRERDLVDPGTTLVPWLGEGAVQIVQGGGSQAGTVAFVLLDAQRFFCVALQGSWSAMRD